jgi:glycosyltransferase involved in cell wall biosynthesis
LEALSSALGRCENAVAVLFGRGPMLGYMQAIHASLPFRQRIHILGYTDRLWEYMRRANIFISLSVFEGNPNVVLEAAAAGCPLVLSDIPEHREIVDEESAMLVPVQDGNAAAEAIIKLLADPERASQLALAAYERICEWSVPRAAQQYSELYERVLS